jgi:hypothetical protein
LKAVLYEKIKGKEGNCTWTADSLAYEFKACELSVVRKNASGDTIQESVFEGFPLLFYLLSVFSGVTHLFPNYI